MTQRKTNNDLKNDIFQDDIYALEFKNPYEIYPSATANYQEPILAFSEVDDRFAHVSTDFNDLFPIEAENLSPIATVVAEPIDDLAIAYFVNPCPLLNEELYPQEIFGTQEFELFPELLNDSIEIKLLDNFFEPVVFQQQEDYKIQQENAKIEAKKNRQRAIQRLKEKREKNKRAFANPVKLEILTSTRSLSPPPTNLKVSRRKIATSKRVRENGKFKKSSTTWIPVDEFKSQL